MLVIMIGILAVGVVVMYWRTQGRARQDLFRNRKARARARRQLPPDEPEIDPNFIFDDEEKRE